MIYICAICIMKTSFSGTFVQSDCLLTIDTDACVWLWLWSDMIKLVMIIFVPINVLYDNHMCVILFILQHASIRNIFR